MLLYYTTTKTLLNLDCSVGTKVAEGKASKYPIYVNSIDAYIVLQEFSTVIALKPTKTSP